MEENLALEVLKRWAEVNPGNLALVPEHVETRSLYDPEKPGVEQVTYSESHILPNYCKVELNLVRLIEKIN